MTLRSLLAAGLLAAPTLASAQSVLSGGPATAVATDLAESTDLSSIASSAVPLGATAGRGALAPCTANQTVTQPFVTGATGLLPVGNTATAEGTPQEAGQSYTAPCDGIQSAFAFVGQTTVASQQVTGTLTIYAGAGTAGTLLITRPFGFNFPATPGAFNLSLSLAPFAVVQGQVYTAFIDITTSTGDMPFNIQFVNPGTYAEGELYLSTSGGPAGATPVNGTIDLRFTSTFNPLTTVQSPQVFNPSSAEVDGAGWRLLASPVSGVSVTTLAQQNLVQGYDPGSDPTANPGQYPDAASNLLIAYNQNGFFGGAAVAGTDFTPRQGTGYFWYFYDRAITPPANTAGGGTSTSRELTGFRLTATGVAATANVTTGYYFASTDGAYMLGNPFARPFQLSGITKTAGDGTLGTVFSAFDPSVGVSGSYVTLAPASFVAPWQGVFANVAASTTTPTFSYAFASTSTTATPPFYGRDAAEGGIAFSLDGETAAGTVGDRATEVRFLDDALVGLDRHDGVKLLPPGDTYALLAPVAAVDGEARRFSVNSLPEALADVSVPLAFTTTHAGTFTLTWASTLGDARTASLRDLATGAVVDLDAATEYAFAAEAGDWAERFELVVAQRGATAGEAGPTVVALGAPRPNPSSGRSTLALSVDAAQAVRAVVIDALGREVAVVFEGALAPGTETTLTLDTARLAPGAYVVRVVGETFAESRRMTVAR